MVSPFSGWVLAGAWALNDTGGWAAKDAPAASHAVRASLARHRPVGLLQPQPRSSKARSGISDEVLQENARELEGVLQAKRAEIIELLTRAYWMEMETVINYVTNSVNPDGVRAPGAGAPDRRTHAPAASASAAFLRRTRVASMPSRLRAGNRSTSMNALDSPR